MSVQHSDNERRISSDATTLDVDNISHNASPKIPDSFRSGLSTPIVGDQTPVSRDGLSTPSDATPNEKSDAAPPAPAAPEEQRTKLETFLIMLALCIALFLAALDMTIVTTVIPTISAHFNSTTGYVWIGSAYFLGNATMVPTWGKISDIFGRKPVLLAAVSVFLVGSLLCAVSQNMGMLIAARAIQGIGGGGTIVLPNICVSDLFSMRKRGLYFGILGMVWACAAAIGPILGGVFASKVSWRWCFYINLPFGGAALTILVLFLKLHNPRTPVKQGLAAIDWVGNILIIGGTLMLLFGLEFGGVKYPWKSPAVICLIIFGFFTLIGFGFYEAKVAKYPVIPLRLLKHQTSLAAYALSIMHAISFMGSTYWLPLYFQSVLTADALHSGIYLLPAMLSQSIISTIVGFIIKKTGNYRWPIIGGLAIGTLGFGLLIDLGDHPHWARIILFQIVVGIGIGPNFQAPLIAIQSTVEPRDIGAATSGFSFIRQIGTSISVTVGGAVFNNVMQSQKAALSAIIGAEEAEYFTAESAAANVHRIKSLPVGDRQPVKSAYWTALQKMFIMFACFSAVGLLISFFVKQKTLSKQHTEHKTGLKSLRVEDHGKTAAADEEKGRTGSE